MTRRVEPKACPTSKLSRSPGGRASDQDLSDRPTCPAAAFRLARGEAISPSVRRYWLRYPRYEITSCQPIGESSIDGLQMEAMKTALDKRLLDLQKRGYISPYSFSISTTLAEQPTGHATIDVTFMPADELVQLTATIGIRPVALREPLCSRSFKPRLARATSPPSPSLFHCRPKHGHLRAERFPGREWGN